MRGLVSSISLMALAVLTNCVGQATGQPNVRLSDYPAGEVAAMTMSAGQRGLAVKEVDADHSVVAAVWSDTRTDKSNVFAVRSLDGGKTFGTPTRVNDQPDVAHLFGATVAVDNQGRIHVVWFDERDGDHDIYYSCGTPPNEGVGFSTNVKVNDDETREPDVDEFGDPEFLEPGAFQALPSIAVDGQGTVYVAWQDYRHAQADIYFSKSADGGKTFTRNIRVSDEIGRAGQLFPSLAVSKSGAIYMAWHDHRKGNADIFFARSMDGGRTFSPNIMISDDRGEAHQFNPSLAVDEQDRVYVAWHDLRNDGQPDIFFARSLDGGATFEQNVLVSDDHTGAFQFRPSIAVGQDGVVHVTWEDRRNGSYDIYYSKSRDGGQTFERNQRLNDDGFGDQLFSSIAVAATRRPLVMWSDQRNDRREPSVCQPIRCSDIYLFFATESTR